MPFEGHARTFWDLGSFFVAHVNWPNEKRSLKLEDACLGVALPNISNNAGAEVMTVVGNRWRRAKGRNIRHSEEKLVVHWR